MERDIEKLESLLNAELPGLAAQLKMAPQFRKEELRNYKLEGKGKKSAVLILFNPFAEDLSIILTKRSAHLKHHRGQVSFPGGRVDKADKDDISTALRETHEEIGINPEDIKVLGRLSRLIIPPTNFDVCPIVGILTKSPSYLLSLDEVESVVEVPIVQLLDKQNTKQKLFTTSSSGNHRKAPYYDVMGLEIWGATAMIISELVEVLKKKLIVE